MKKRDYNQHHSHGGVEHQTLPTKQNKKSVLKKLKFFLFAFLFLILLFIIFLKMPLFKIKKIMISGTSNIELINQVEELAGNYLKNQKINNFAFLKSDNLKFYIKEQIDLEKIEINKKFPDKLLILIEPEIPALFWQEGENYFLIDKNGIVDTQITLSQIEYELPVISAATTTKVITHQKLVNENFIEFIREFNKNFNKTSLNLKITKYILPNLKGREVWAMSDAGFKIILTTDSNIILTLDVLKKLIKEKFTESAPKEYIDLRLEEKVFYK